MSADSPRRSSGSIARGVMSVPAIVPPQVVSDRSILDSAIGFINDVTLAHPPPIDPKDTITWARFETSADISDSRFGEDWELEGNIAPPLLLILGYGLGVQVWAIPANGEAVEVLSWRHGIVSALRVLPTPSSKIADEDNSRADEPNDAFGDKRPLIALVDGSSTSGSQPQFCAVNFISLKTGAQVKTIKFKNPVIDILANRTSIVITFHERIAVFDARSLEDRLSITTCYPSPGINPNPAALGPRWLAYAENKLLHTKRSGGGCDGDGVASYTATVLNASKSLVKGLRELGEQVAAGLTGTSGSTGNSKNASFDSACGIDSKQAGIVTIIDVKNSLRDYSPTSSVQTSSNHTAATDTMIAHFIAHSEALVAVEFDNSGMLLVTADRRGHDFHVFRIQPNPLGSSLAAVHHLYILHRGDTSAKVQNITLTLDSRWVAVSTLRGTTHVFPITPYGGSMGVRTHSSLHVVNKLSRFHRSAGLSGDGRSNSPISHSEITTYSQPLQPYNNSTLPPFPRPTVVMPLAQLRQPFALGSPPGSASLAGGKSAAGVSASGTQRQRLSSLSDDSGKPLSVCAIFAKSRSWLLDPPNVTREASHRVQRKAVDSLFVMAGHGALIQYDLGTKLASNVAKEKICDDTPIELEVEAKAQWNLGRRKEGSEEIMPPLPLDNWLIKSSTSSMFTDSIRQYDDLDERSESWLAQVEIITHAGPHRRLWMGPQFVFKTYNSPSGSSLNHVDIEAIEIGTIKPSSSSGSSEKLDHSNPLNMPLTAAGRSNAVPVLIESGSYSSIEQSPKLMDRFRHDHLDSDYSVAHGDSRLKEDLADAMRESPATASSKDNGGHACESGGSSDNVDFYDALTAEDDQLYAHAHLASAAALASVLPNIHSYDNSSSYESLDLGKKQKGSIEKIVNPLGTVTTVPSCTTADVKTDILDEVVSQLSAEDTIIHENCDESLFRPVVAIFCDEKTLLQNEEEARMNYVKYLPPEVISNKLVVPVIEKDLNDELSKREKEKNSTVKCKAPVVKTKPSETQGSADCWKTAHFKKETSEELKMTPKKRTKKETYIQKKQSNELQNQTVDVQMGKDAFQDMVLGNIDKKKLENSLNENEKIDLNATNTVTKAESMETKCKAKSILSNENDSVKNIRGAPRISKENVECDHAPILCNVDKNEIIKTKSASDNLERKSEQRFISTQTSSTKSHTAIKEKVKKTKESTKFNISDTNYNNITKQLAADPGVMETTEPTIKDSEMKKTNATSKAAEKVKICSTINSFECEKRDILKPKSNADSSNFNKEGSQCTRKDTPKNRAELKTLVSTNEKLGKNEKTNRIKEATNEPSNSDDSVEPKKKETVKENEILNKKQKHTEDDNTVNLEMDLSICENANLEEQNLKYAKFNDDSSNSKRESKEKSIKAKWEVTGMKNAKSNEQQSETNCGKNKQVNNYEHTNKDSFSLEIECASEKVKKNYSSAVADYKNVTEQKKEAEETAKIISTDETNNCDLIRSNTNNRDFSKETAPTKMKEIKVSFNNEIKEDEVSSKKKTVGINIIHKEKMQTHGKKENAKSGKENSNSNSNYMEEHEISLDMRRKPNSDENKLPGPTVPQKPAWKTLGDADMIKKNLNISESEINMFPLLSPGNKMNNCNNLRPKTLTPSNIEKQRNLDDFQDLKMLDPLPPLPDLEPLQLLTENSSISLRDISLITFESPLLENRSLQRKITPTPRGFTEENLILALCGSLHYQSEQTEKTELSPTFSSNHSSTVFEDTSLADYKSLTENDDPYMSLEQSSQETNTTNTNTNNEKCFSSTNSSGSEEIIIMEEKKMTKKQKRKKQQQLKEFESRKEQTNQQEIYDEELRPLIVMTDSQVDQQRNFANETLSASVSNSNKNPFLATQSTIYSTTTDSDGPLPATTSDDNVFSIPVLMPHNPHKIKTKKLEHKINLIAAIEAATSSSTSSAEESGVELGGRSSQENAELLTSEANSISTSTIQLPIVANSQITAGAQKKKTKRRKR